MNTTPPKPSELRLISWPHILIATVSFWFGMLALLLEMVVASGYLLGWAYVRLESGQLTKRFWITIMDESGNGSVDAAKAMLSLVVVIAVLGLVLGHIALFIRHQSKTFVTVAILMNLLVFLVPLLTPRIIWE